MKSINMLVVMVFITFSPVLIASNSAVLNVSTEKLISNTLHNVEYSACEVELGTSQLKDCTITIKNEDGTTLEVTFHDVTWFQCVKIKVGKWIADTF